VRRLVGVAESSLSPEVADLALRSHLIGGMPILNHGLSRLDLDTALERAVPDNDARLASHRLRLSVSWCTTSWWPTARSTQWES
jgi:hypothetical protein